MTIGPDTAMDHAAALAELCDRYWAFQCDEFPMVAIMASQPVAHDELLRESPADHERRARVAEEMLGQLAMIDVAALGLLDRATHTMLRRELRLLVDTVVLQAHLRPCIFPWGSDFWLNAVAGMVSLQTEADAQRWLARMRRIAAGLRGVQATLAAGMAAGLRTPRLVVERAAAQVAALAAIPAADSALYGPFARAADRFGTQAAEALRLIEQEIYPAWHSHAAFIAATLGSSARDTVACTDNPQGEAFYRLQIQIHTTQRMDAAEVHDLGLVEVQRIAAQMREAAAGAGFAGDLAGYVQRLKNDPAQVAPGADALLAEIESLSKRIDSKLPEFFGHLPRSTYGVKLMSLATAEKSPPAYAQPSPADNSAAGVHWVTSLPEKCPRYMHVPIALHEAWPGHLMHIALMQEQGGLPAFRRYGALSYTACLEGWALYCENLGHEMGLYDTADKLYGRLEMEMWRALRLVADTGLHAMGWSREQAIDLMLEHTAMQRVTIEAEVDRYIGWPGQALAYQIGNLKFRGLHERAQARLGERFNRRDFHDALMAAGPATLEVLDEHIDAWIEAQAR